MVEEGNRMKNLNQYELNETNSRLKQFKVDKARNGKVHKVQNSLKVQSLHNFQKWNILTLGGAEVKYLPMTPEGALFV